MLDTIISWTSKGLRTRIAGVSPRIQGPENEELHHLMMAGAPVLKQEKIDVPAQGEINFTLPPPISPPAGG